MKVSFAVFLLLGLFSLLLPGQNFYQTTQVTVKKPLLQELPVIIPSPAPYPVKTTQTPLPKLTAGSVLILDLNSALVLYEKKSQLRFSPASITKIMTALVALEEYDLDNVLTVETVETGGRFMGLKQGEQIAFENLLYGLLVHSANDAAVVLAENYPGGREKFLAAMNYKAKKIKMANTHFANETGFEQEGHYVSALDLSRLASYALQNPILLQAVETKKITVWDVERKEAHRLENVNTLLGKIPGLYGLKTGWTEDAGECLVAVVEKGGHRILTVVLKSEDRFGESEKLINWVFANYRWMPQSTL